MELDPDICYRALEHADARFDGRFFTAVRTTGIYCRPVCPAPRPKRINCTFYPSAAAAEQAGYRACRRCRPEAAPGSPAWAGVETTVQRALRLIEDGALDAGSVDDLAERLGIGARHLRRLFMERLGASPLAVAQTQRLHLAKRLVETTGLPMTDVALAAGFQSLRRFNDAFSKTFQRSPSALRKEEEAPFRQHGNAPHSAPFLLTLTYRPPFDWSALLGFLRQRTLCGIEACGIDTYARAIHTEDGPGVIEARFLPNDRRLHARLHLPSPQSLRPAIRRLRALFDLDADSGVIDRHLALDPGLRDQIDRRPGLRVPGTWDAFEYSCRAIIGQQVSVKGARTVANRLAARLGTPLPKHLLGVAEGVESLFPTAAQVAHGDLSKLGMPDKRAETLRTIARAFLDAPLTDVHSLSPEDVRAALVALPGIGPWTAESIAMRALGDPDAFPGTDLGVLKALDLDLTADGRQALAARAESWRPWRAYATVRLWTFLEDMA